jgi:hypothetical protein
MRSSNLPRQKPVARSAREAALEQEVLRLREQLKGLEALLAAPVMVPIPLPVGPGFPVDPWVPGSPLPWWTISGLRDSTICATISN